MISNEQYLEVCNSRFLFLSSDYGLDQVCEKNEDWGFAMVYKNQMVGVNLTFELRDFYLFVKVVRLLGGNFPSSPGEIQPNTILDSFDLDDIVGLRSSDSLIPPYKGSTSFNLSFFDQIVSTQAENLRVFASDLLGGDFSIFAELDRVVKERAREAAFQKWGNRAIEFGWTK